MSKTEKKAEPTLEDRVARLERSAEMHGWFLATEPPYIPPQPEPPKE